MHIYIAILIAVSFTHSLTHYGENVTRMFVKRSPVKIPVLPLLDDGRARVTLFAAPFSHRRSNKPLFVNIVAVCWVWKMKNNFESAAMSSSSSVFEPLEPIISDLQIFSKLGAFPLAFKGHELRNGSAITFYGDPRTRKRLPRMTFAPRRQLP